MELRTETSAGAPNVLCTEERDATYTLEEPLRFESKYIVSPSAVADGWPSSEVLFTPLRRKGAPNASDRAARLAKRRSESEPK
jgi:hypothetical protein